MSNRAWVTLATNDSYGLGALVLAHSLRRTNTAHPAVVLITPSVSEAMRNRLSAVFAEVITVDVLDSKDAAHLALLQRPELGITFTKIHCWTLTQYEKCVFLDADTLVVQNCDELFEREELSAAPDVGWPDCFNSGVFVYVPSSDTYSRLITFAQERGSFDGGDQGLLNAFFADWARGDINKHLPFLYNVTSAAFYSYIPALKHYGQDLKIIHFIGTAKPWLQNFNWDSRTVDAPDHLRELLQLWWDLFVGQVHSQLDMAMDSTVDVEEPDLEPPPEDPPEDIHHIFHYEPRIDPQSEFPWHHPEEQSKETDSEQQKINLDDFYDPWQHYKGNVSSFNQLSNEGNVLWEHQKSYDGNTWKNPPHQHRHNEQHLEHFNQYNNPNQSQKQQHDSSSHHQNTFQHNWPYLDHNTHSQSHQEEHQVQETHQHNEPYQKLAHWQSNQPSNTYSDQSTHHGPHSQNEQSETHQHRHGQYDNFHAETHIVAASEHSQKHSDQSWNQHNGYTRYLNPFTTQPKVEQVYQVHLDHRPRHRRHRRVDRLHICTNGINGHESDSESEEEFIIPRHPYDGFYLRHRSTIDSRGRKICSHEIPPAPSPTPSLEDDPPFFPVVSPVPEEFETASECEEQYSGVAGNLARVVPGSSSYQRDAIDELTRRQGWEAGNIDYMGADSFNNIWAKISQTLNQQPAKEPSPPRKEPTPPRKEPSPPKDQPQPEATVPQSEVSAPASQTDAPVSAPKPSEAPAPSPQASEATASAPQPSVAPVPSPQPSEKPAPGPEPIEAPTPAPKPSEAPAPAPQPSEAPAPAPQASEAPASAPKPSEAPTPVPQAIGAPASAPKPEAPAPASTPAAPTAPVPEASKPTPVESPPVQAEVPKIVAKETPAEKTEKQSTVPPTPPATPKSTPEASTPVSEVPEPVLVAQSAPAPAEASKAAAPKAPASPAPAAEAPAAVPAETTPEKSQGAAASTDSPPLANTPSKDEAPAVPAAKSEERRKPVGKLTLSPPAAADALPTPDSEAEDAAALAHAIIASELGAVTAPSPAASPASPPAPQDEKKLSVDAPDVPTPPVSLEQIGIKPKAKPTIAAQIESSVSETPAPVEPAKAAPQTPPTPASPTEPAAPGGEGKKKPAKKGAKKEAGSSGDAPAPVPPPRKKEKKPKEK